MCANEREEYLSSAVDEFCEKFLLIMNNQEYKYVECLDYNVFSCVIDQIVCEDLSKKYVILDVDSEFINTPMFQGDNSEKYYYHKHNVSPNNHAKTVGLKKDKKYKFLATSNGVFTIDDLESIFCEIKKVLPSIQLAAQKPLLLLFYKFFEFNINYYGEQLRTSNYIYFCKLIFKDCKWFSSVFKEIYLCYVSDESVQSFKEKNHENLNNLLNDNFNIQNAINLFNSDSIDRDGYYKSFSFCFVTALTNTFRRFEYFKKNDFTTIESFKEIISLIFSD